MKDFESQKRAKKRGVWTSKNNENITYALSMENLSEGDTHTKKNGLIYIFLRNFQKSHKYSHF